MKSVIKISSKAIAIRGSVRLTDFRIASLKEKFQHLSPVDLSELNCNEIYFCSLNDKNKIEKKDSLEGLFNILSVDNSSDYLEEEYLVVIPRT